MILKKKNIFAEMLLKWHKTSNNRELPWKKERDIYKIWLSEILLQQTRALQAIPYYNNFIDTFPTVKELAEADEQKIFTMWQGLGYYNRCRNMIATAKKIHLELKGQFPKKYIDLLTLKGIGPYSAAAIASFGFNENVAVVDGNVYRVLARYFDMDQAIDTVAGKKVFTNQANALLPLNQARIYNQAIMDFGATICTPQKPSCTICPLKKSCIGLRKDRISVLPQKSKKIRVIERFFHYLVFDDGQHIYLQKRENGDIWANLWQPLLIETTNEQMEMPKGIKEKPSLFFTGKQRLTHQIIHSFFYRMPTTQKVPMNLNLLKIAYQDVSNFAFPKTCLEMLKSAAFI